MDILPLLRKRLKDDDMIEVLEWLGTEVVYDFDRSHENLPDVYWAIAKDHGVTLRFNENQALDTVFVYMQPSEGHLAADRSIIADVALFDSDSEVRSYAAERDIHIATSSRPASLPPSGSWVRLEYGRHQVHYEFRAAVLSLVTISSVDEGTVA